MTTGGAAVGSVALMGVLNVTPDSFSDGGAWTDTDAAVAHGRALLDAGARVVDVGGESTRPGAAPVGVDEELSRVVPVIERIAPYAASQGGRISVDTRHEVVARAAVAAGASILNDVSASLEEVAADLGAGWMAMHMQGEPATMQDAPAYGDVVEEVLAFLLDAAARAERAGVTECWIDPGIGFGKTHDHNWTLLAHLDRFVATGVPVLVGASRKGFIGALHTAADGRSEPVPAQDRLEGSMVVAIWAATMGVDMIRVHDVAATRSALRAAAVRPQVVA